MSSPVKEELAKDVQLVKQSLKGSEAESVKLMSTSSLKARSMFQKDFERVLKERRKSSTRKASRQINDTPSMLVHAPLRKHRSIPQECFSQLSTSPQEQQTMFQEHFSQSPTSPQRTPKTPEEFQAMKRRRKLSKSRTFGSMTNLPGEEIIRRRRLSQSLSSKQFVGPKIEDIRRQIEQRMTPSSPNAVQEVCPDIKVIRHQEEQEKTPSSLNAPQEVLPVIEDIQRQTEDGKTSELPALAQELHPDTDGVWHQKEGRKAMQEVRPTTADIRRQMEEGKTPGTPPPAQEDGLTADDVWHQIEEAKTIGSLTVTQEVHPAIKDIQCQVEEGKTSTEPAAAQEIRPTIDNIWHILQAQQSQTPRRSKAISTNESAQPKAGNRDQAAEVQPSSELPQNQPTTDLVEEKLSKILPISNPTLHGLEQSESPHQIPKRNLEQSATGSVLSSKLHQAQSATNHFGQDVSDTLLRTKLSLREPKELEVAPPIPPQNPRRSQLQPAVSESHLIDQGLQEMKITDQAPTRRSTTSQDSYKVPETASHPEKLASKTTAKSKAAEKEMKAMQYSNQAPAHRSTTSQDNFKAAQTVSPPKTFSSNSMPRSKVVGKEMQAMQHTNRAPTRQSTTSQDNFKVAETVSPPRKLSSNITASPGVVGKEMQAMKITSQAPTRQSKGSQDSYKVPQTVSSPISQGSILSNPMSPMNTSFASNPASYAHTVRLARTPWLQNQPSRSQPERRGTQASSDRQEQMASPNEQKKKSIPQTMLGWFRRSKEPKATERPSSPKKPKKPGLRKRLKEWWRSLNTGKATSELEKELRARELEYDKYATMPRTGWGKRPRRLKGEISRVYRSIGMVAPVRFKLEKKPEQLAKDKAALERFLRWYYFCRRVAHDPTSGMQEHPHHRFRFPQRNLWCAACTGTCSRCGAHCCTVHEMLAELERGRLAPHAWTKLQVQVNAVIAAVKGGTDPQTFMRCIGCEKVVCPKCASICTDPICQGPICISCSPAKYFPCEWHVGLKLAPGEGAVDGVVGGKVGRGWSWRGGEKK